MKKKKKKAGAAAKKDKDESKPEPGAEDAVEESEPTEAAAEEAFDEPTTSPRQTISQQSKLRSASFRAGSISGGPLSPGAEGDTAADIYRKQVARIEDLEKENKRLAKEAGDSEKRWQKAEEELTELKDSDGKTGGSDSGEVERLVCVASFSIQLDH